jgi:hypothetical protein
MRGPKTRPEERLQRLHALITDERHQLSDRHRGVLMRAWNVFRAVAESHKGLDRVGRDARARRRGLLKAWDQEMDVFCILAAETIELNEARVQLSQV